MYASWETVEYASTRLMSSWTNAISAAPSIVMRADDAHDLQHHGVGVRVRR